MYICTILAHYAGESFRRFYESVRVRFLVRISKMPVQNSNFKKIACPELATNLLQTLIQQLHL